VHAEELGNGAGARYRESIQLAAFGGSRRREDGRGGEQLSSMVPLDIEASAGLGDEARVGSGQPRSSLDMEAEAGLGEDHALSELEGAVWRRHRKLIRVAGSSFQRVDGLAGGVHSEASSQLALVQGRCARRPQPAKEETVARSELPAEGEDGQRASRWRGNVFALDAMVSPSLRLEVDGSASLPPNWVAVDQPRDESVAGRFRRPAARADRGGAALGSASFSRCP
jgi:hypothetical protein